MTRDPSWSKRHLLSVARPNCDRGYHAVAFGTTALPVSRRTSSAGTLEQKQRTWTPAKTMQEDLLQGPTSVHSDCSHAHRGPSLDGADNSTASRRTDCTMTFMLWSEHL